MAGKIRFKDRESIPASSGAGFFGWVGRRWRLLLSAFSKRKESSQEASPKLPRIRVINPVADRPLRINDPHDICDGCGMTLEGEETVSCTLNAAHIVHKRCGVELLKGKCPKDGAELTATV